MKVPDGHTFRIGEWHVDPGLDQISKDGSLVKLEHRAMQLLLCLAKHAGQVVSVEQLLDEVWMGLVVTPDSVYHAVATLRRLLGDRSKTPTYIANIPRLGYRLIALVEAPSVPSAPAAASAASADKPSIVVMPFVNLGGDPAQQYLSDGITEDLIVELSRWRLLAVRSRSASFRYRGVAVDMKEVARELNVRFVVEGSVRRMGERIRICVQLVDTGTGSPLWAERFDNGLQEIFAVQDRVVQTIVSTLVGRVQFSDAERAHRKPPACLAAYECVLKANSLPWDDPAGAAEATQLFEKAIELDPGYAVAHALLAAMVCRRRWEDDPLSFKSALEQADVLARRALELDDSESTCHAILGHICLQRGRFDLARQYGVRSVEINPNNQWNAADLGTILVYLGEPDEALRWFTRAREIDPYFDAPWYWRGLAHACMHLHRYDEALSALAHARVRHYEVVALTAACQAALGHLDTARISAAECLSLRPEFSIAQFVNREPFKLPADAARLASFLRLAGLPD